MDCDNDVMCEQRGWVQRRKGFFTSTWILFTCRWMNETRHFNQQPEERRRVQNLMATTSSVGSEAEGSSRVYVWGENKFLLILNPSIGRLQCRNYVDICSGSSSRPGRARLVVWLVGLSAFPIPSLGLFLTVVGVCERATDDATTCSQAKSACNGSVYNKDILMNCGSLDGHGFGGWFHNGFPFTVDDGRSIQNHSDVLSRRMPVLILISQKIG